MSITATAPAPTSAPSDRQSGDRASRILGWIAMPIGIVVLLLVGSILSDKFLTVGNLTNVLISMSIIGVIVVGMTFVFISGGMADLSVPGTVAVGAIVVLSLQSVTGPVVAVLVAVATAAVAGLANGWLIGYARVNPVIATLGTGTIVLGIAQAFVGGVIVYGDSPETQALLTGKIFGVVPSIVVVFVAVAVIGHLVLSRTTLGRWTYAVGGNFAAAEASALPVRRAKLMAFLMTGALSGFAGVLLGISLQTARPGIGFNYEFDAITAVVVGGVSLLGGFGSIPRAISGLLFVQLLGNILVLQGVPSAVQGIAKGALIAAAVAFDMYLRRKGNRQ